MDRFVFIHTMQAIGLLLAANACAYLSAIDNPKLEQIFLGFGTGCLIFGLFMLFLVVV